MFKDFRLGSYVQGNSILHRLDPRTKLGALAVLAMSAFLIANWLGLVAFFLVTIALAMLTRVSLKYYWATVRSMWLILLLTVLVNGVSQPGTPLVKAGPLVLTVQGFQIGGMMAVRLALIVLLTTTFTLTTSPIALTDGLERLFRPLGRLGFPGHEIALMMTIAIRFIPTLIDEGQRLVWALEARGGEVGGKGLIKKVRGLLPLFVPLFIGAFRRADELALAMEIRGYRGGKGRTRYRELTLHRGDYGTLAVTLALLLLILLLRWQS
ncbi:MAG TPA: energy-coupling factor transporter transmembrane component T [Desulfobacteria bacterium]|nr:energy-coupling factor transporter transmembrane component T [Desulfobacteria bacterium]